LLSFLESFYNISGTQVFLLNVSLLLSVPFQCRIKPVDYNKPKAKIKGEGQRYRMRKKKREKKRKKKIYWPWNMN